MRAVAHDARHSSFAALLAVALTLACAARRVQAEAPVAIPLVVHVAHVAGEPVADQAFWTEQVARANELFEPLGFRFDARLGTPLAQSSAELTTRSDRDRLARHVRRGAVHCFVIAKLMDVDEPGRERRGVHWHARTRPVRYVIVSKISGPYVLAHELGHYFGNREHSDVAGNLMSYTRAEGAPFLDAAQQRRIRETFAALLKRGEILPRRNEVAH
jgi:hypothetical protein